MNLRYEIIDTQYPDWRGQRFTDLQRARNYVRKSTNPDRFIIKDRFTKEIVK